MHGIINQAVGTEPRTTISMSRAVRLLLVTDDKGQADLIRECLSVAKRTDVEVAHVGSLSESLVHLSKDTPDAILLDASLPDGAGLDALSAVQASAPDVPIIVLVGEDGGPTADDALRAGAHDYLEREELSAALLERSLLYCLERSRAEEEIERSERRYEHLVNSVDSIVWEGDANTFEFTFVSEQAERILGYPTERWTTEPTFWYDHIHPDDREWAPGFCAIATAEMRAHQFEYRMIAADGRIAWLRDIVAVVVENGRPVKLRGVMVDITEQKRAEQELRLSEARYRALFEQAPFPVRVFSADGRTREANKAWMEFSGITVDQLNDVSILDEQWHATSGALPYLRKAFAGEVTELPIVAYVPPAEHNKGEGRRFWMKASAYAVKDEAGSVQEVVTVTQDITEQKETEEALRLSEERFRALFEQSPIPVHTFSPDGKTRAANQAWLDLFGVTADIALNYNILTDERHVELGTMPYIRRAFAGEAVELPLIYFDGAMQDSPGMGRACWAKGHAYPIKDSSGAVVEVVFVVEDVTEQKEAEDALKEKEEQYRSIFEATSDGLVINDANGKAVEVNPAFCEMHGYSREELIGADLSMLHPPDSKPVYWEYLDTVKEGRFFMTQDMHLHQRKDGALFNVEVHGTTFTYKGEPHILGVVRDVTERIKAEEKLKATEQQYRSIFEATTDGLAINDLDGNLIEVNPAFCEMHGYSREEMLSLGPGHFIHPDSQHLFTEYIETVKAGGQFQAQAKDVRKDGTVFHVEVNGTSFLYNGKPHVLAVVRDITERVRAYELLEQRVEERTRQLSTLLEVSHDVASTLELKPLLGSILHQLKRVLDYSQASISVLEGDKLAIVDSRMASGEESAAAGWRFGVERLGAAWENLKSGEPVIIPDVRSDDILARTYREALAELTRTSRGEIGGLMETRLGYVRSWLSVPLMLKDNAIGTLALAHGEPGYYTPVHANLARAIANQVAIAIENARLYEQAQETTRKTAALAQSASQITFGGSLPATLEVLCQHVVDVTGAVASAVLLRDPESGQNRMASTYGLPDGYADALNSVLSAGVPMLMQDAFAGRQPMFVHRMRQLILDSPQYAPLHPFMQGVPWDTVVAVPMFYRDNPVGVLLSYHPASANIGETELTLHTVIANQAAVAVENARLLTEVQGKAALEERQRLARELHDSVTQALFSINLTARSIEVLLQRAGMPSDDIMEKMTDLRHLTQGALAEMRALIFELRPGALEEEGLVQAIRKHAAAVQGREMLQVEVIASEQLPRLKPDAEEALYRIAQEALHNVVKHARASRVEVAADVDGDCLVLRIRDDGLGFDLSQVPAGHMGLGTMRQRTDALGGKYVVESAPGRGTLVRVSVPLSEWQLQVCTS